VIYAPPDAVTRGLDKVFEIMNHKADIEWRLVIVGPDRGVAEFAWDHQTLTGLWERIRVYACELPLGTFTEDNSRQLWADLNEVSIYMALSIVDYIHER